MKKVYTTIFEKDLVGYGIYFPDVEGAVTQSEDVAEGLEMASDALRIMLGYLVENIISLPTPSDLNAISYNPENQFVTLVSVDLKDTELDKKTIQVPYW